MSDEVWLIRRKVDASKQIFVATKISLFDFGLFIGVQREFIVANFFNLPVQNQLQ